MTKKNHGAILPQALFAAGFTCCDCFQVIKIILNIVLINKIYEIVFINWENYFITQKKGLDNFSSTILIAVQMLKI